MLTFCSCSVTVAIWEKQAWTCLSYATFLFLSNTCPHRPEVEFSAENYTERCSVTVWTLRVYKRVIVRPNDTGSKRGYTEVSVALMHTTDTVCLCRLCLTHRKYFGLRWSWSWEFIEDFIVFFMCVFVGLETTRSYLPSVSILQGHTVASSIVRVIVIWSFQSGFLLAQSSLLLQ